MALDYRFVNVVDIEATCWQPRESQPKGTESEIIEIGIVQLDMRSRSVIKSDSIMIKPIEAGISEFCTQLTTITQADVEKGIPYAEAVQKLITEYKSDKLAWGSWGDYDREMFVKNSKRRGVPYPFNKTHFNFKAINAIKNQLPRAYEVGKALNQFGLTFEGTPHRGIDDAKNIARLVFKVLG